MCFVPRTRTNLQIVESALFSQLHNSFHSEWQDGLEFLSSFKLTPPPFRQSLITKVKWRLEENICDTFTSVIEIGEEALKKPTHHRFNRTSEFDPTPLLFLPVLFEQLILFPIDPTIKNANVNQIIHDRLRRFKQGKLRELYFESQQVKSKTPKEHTDNPASTQKCAQIAADLDNIKSASARLTKHAPVAKISDGIDGNFEVLQNLHPPSLNRGCIKAKRSSRTGDTRRKIKFTPKQILAILSRLHRGKAPGLQCNSLDIYIKCAQRIDLKNTRR